MSRRKHGLAEAFARQSLHAIEQTVLDKGDWSLGLTYAGLAELKSMSRARRGGAPPSSWRPG
jgi:hypothetical protein